MTKKAVTTIEYGYRQSMFHSNKLVSQKNERHKVLLKRVNDRSSFSQFFEKYDLTTKYYKNVQVSAI